MRVEFLPERLAKAQRYFARQRLATRPLTPSLSPEEAPEEGRGSPVLKGRISLPCFVLPAPHPPAQILHETPETLRIPAAVAASRTAIWMGDGGETPPLRRLRAGAAVAVTAAGFHSNVT
jgi:hypothetical protein